VSIQYRDGSYSEIMPFNEIMERFTREMDELRIALEESLLLQTHYAGLLNQYDGGNRMCFYTVDQWLNRLREVGKLPSQQVDPADG